MEEITKKLEMVLNNNTALRKQLETQVLENKQLVNKLDLFLNNNSVPTLNPQPERERLATLALENLRQGNRTVAQYFNMFCQHAIVVSKVWSMATFVQRFRRGLRGDIQG